MRNPKLLRLFTIILFGIITGCSFSCKPTNRRIETDNPKPPPENSQMGTSIDRAIIIKAKSIEERVLLEKEWINKIYPSSVPLSTEPIKIDDDNEIIVFTHYIEVIDNHTYSIHNVSLPDGAIKSVYFDITEFWRGLKQPKK